MGERTILVTGDSERARMIRAVQAALRKRAIELTQGTVEIVLEVYDAARVRRLMA